MATTKTELTVVEPGRANIIAGSRPMAIVPTSLDECYRLAKAVCMAGMAPRGLDKPEAAMVAILHGLEVGLTPMMALQRIAVVNGRPTIWGDGAMSLVRASGRCEYVKETIAGEGDSRVAICEVLRRGDPLPTIRRFSVADAKKAKLWTKGGPWQEYPERMLQMRARAFALRDAFADVLGGLYLREEIEETPRHGKVTTEGPAFVEADPFGLPPIDDTPGDEDRAALNDAPMERAADDGVEYSEEPTEEGEPWPEPEPETPRDTLLAQGRAAAINGPKKLNLWLGKLSVLERSLLTEMDMRRLTEAAQQAG